MVKALTDYGISIPYVLPVGIVPKTMGGVPDMKQDEMIMIPYVVHEGDMAREEWKQKRLWILLIVQILLTSLIAWKK